MAAQPLNPLEQALEWIGFVDPAQRTRVLTELGSDLTSFLRYGEKDIVTLQKTMAEIRPATLQVHFGLSRTKSLKAMVHWAKDLDRIDQAPTLANYGDGISFLEDLRNAEERARIREQMIAGSDSRAKAASPGKLKDEKGWNTWEQALSTHLNILVGVNGVPLIYVIREDEADPTTEYDTFIEETIAKARLVGPEFEADSLQVHQIIRALTVGEHAEQWLKPLAKHKDGRRDMEALRAHYRGAGNQSRRIAVAQRMQSQLHYKGERAMPFSTFISKVQEMFNIFAACHEEFAESAKLRFLFEHISATPLQPAIETLKAQLGQNPTSWSFVNACNHLASQITSVESSSRQLSEVNRGGADGASSSGIYDKDGKIRFSFNNNEWTKLTHDEKSKVHAARKESPRARKKPGRGGTGRGGGRGGNRSVQELAKMVKKQTKLIAAISGKKRTDATSDDEDDSSAGSAPADAGNAFGGREAKKQSKKKKT